MKTLGDGDATLTPDQVWQEIKERVEEVADSICGRRTPVKKQQWMATEILEMMDQRRKVKAQINREEYKKLCQDIQRESRKARRVTTSNSVQSLKD